MALIAHDFVNVDLIDRTIASIRRGPFNMSCWARCICGHVNRVQKRASLALGLGDLARRELGISPDEGVRLFASNVDATKEEAIKVLEILRDEGVVDWVRACFLVALAERVAQRPHGARRGGE